MRPVEIAGMRLRLPFAALSKSFRLEVHDSLFVEPYSRFWPEPIGIWH
jgi:hypothetical protein